MYDIKWFKVLYMKTDLVNVLRDRSLGELLLVHTFEKIFATYAFRGTNVEQKMIVNDKVWVGAEILHSLGDVGMVHVNQISVLENIFVIK